MTRCSVPVDIRVAPGCWIIRRQDVYGRLAAPECRGYWEMWRICTDFDRTIRIIVSRYGAVCRGPVDLTN